MDNKKERGKEVEMALDYYENWVEGSKPVKGLLDLEEHPEAVIIGNREGPIKMTERGIEVSKNVFLHEIKNVLYKLKDALSELISIWTKSVEDIESYLNDLDLYEEDEIRELLKSKKDTIELAKGILDWMDDPIAQEEEIMVLRELEDPPFEELRELAKNLLKGTPREKIIARISMKI